MNIKGPLAQVCSVDQKICTFIAGHLEVLFVICITIVAAYARYRFLGFESVDYLLSLKNWYLKLAEEGFSAFRNPFADYNATYLYLLYLMSLLKVPPLLGIKTVSIAADFVLALFAARIVFRLTGGRTGAIVCYALTLLAPTVVLNGAAWAQCDAVYTMFIVISIFYLISEKYGQALCFYGLSFCFKLQAVFVLPVYFILAVQGLFPLFYLLALPLFYVLLHLPTLLAGAPLKYVFLRSYILQSRAYHVDLTLNAPSFWVFMPNIKVMHKAAISFGLGFVGIATFIGFATRAVRANMLAACVFFSIFIPFVLPRMHERYFFIADVLTIIYACARPRRFMVPLLTGFASLMAYLPFLFNTNPVPHTVSAALMAVAWGIVAMDLWQSAKNGARPDAC